MRNAHSIEPAAIQNLRACIDADCPIHGARRIESRPDVCGGAACVSGTRIPVWLLESYRRLGLTDEQLLEAYPTLTEQDIQAAWEHVAEHRALIEREIEENGGDER